MPKLKRLAAIIFVLLIAGIVFVAGTFRKNYVVPVIMYHSVTENPDPKNRLAVSAKTFERQMRYLRDRKYSILSLKEVVESIKAKKKFPPRAIAVTFDDGYKDNYIYAFPVLKKYRIPVTLFIIVQEVGRPQDDRLSWGQIKEMRDSGLVAIGSHTIGPDPLFKAASPEELKRQIFDSKRLLEERLGDRINLFSYPEGMFDAKIRQLVIDAGYLGAVATNPGRGYPSDDIFALKRLRISENASNMFIFAVETSGYYTFMKESKRKHGKK